MTQNNHLLKRKQSKVLIKTNIPAQTREEKGFKEIPKQITRMRITRKEKQGSTRTQ